jgi:hypothetical protein
MIIGLCALALMRGWDIVWFSIAEARLGPDEKRWEALSPWMNIPGLAYSARVSALSTVNDWNDKSAALARRDEEIEILAARPLSADFWLLLSDMRQIAEEDPSKVVEALTISMLIGPNEGYLMAQRGTFAVSIWEMLPPEAKQRGAKDLAAIQLSDIQKGRLRAVLSEKSESVREDIENNLKAAGLSTQRLADIGLTFNRVTPGN